MIGKTISHYKILEKLGEGGMSVVYRAEDTTLRRTVALKFLPRETTGDLKARARFLHEAQAAAALTHSNICRIYEIDEAEGRTFIAMALIDGQDLRDRIAGGPLKMRDAIDITIQVAEGLAAAHEKGIIHRDIKSANVMLTSTGQAKIMDFGLAKSRDQTVVTRAGATVGTVAYMSPEQTRGEGVDHRSDLWSLGVVLYEMITGQRPFKGEHEPGVCYSILNEEPEPITALRTGVPMELERIATKAMAKRREERYQSAPDLIADLRALSRSLESGTRAAAPPTARTGSTVAKARRRAPALVVIAAVLLIVAVGVVLTTIRFQTPALDPSRVVVSVFENRTGDESLNYLGQMAADGIAQGLFRVGLLYSLAQVTVTQSPRIVGTDADATELRDLAAETGAGIVISGAYYPVGGSLQFRAQLRDVAEGKLIRAVPAIDGSLTEPTEGLERLNSTVTSAMAMHLDPWFTHAPETPVPSFEAYSEFILGMGLFGDFDPEAVSRFARATELDSTFARAYVMLAYAYSSWGPQAEQDSVIQYANSRPGLLTPTLRLSLDGLVALADYRDPEALRIYRRLGESMPESFVMNFTRARLAYWLNRPQEAVDTWERCDDERLYDFGAGSWRLWYWAAALHLLGDYEQELDVALRMREYYPDDVSAISSEVRALAALGRTREIDAIVNECLGLAGSESPTGLLLVASLELRAHGHRTEALDVADRAIRWCENRPPSEAATETHRFALARILCCAERWEDARALVEELAAEDADNVSYRTYLGTLAARLGERDEATRISAELESLDPLHEDKATPYNRACIAALLGDRERAVELLKEAHARGMRHGLELHRDPDLAPLHGYPPFEELLRPKG